MHKIVIVSLKALTLGVLTGCLWFYASSRSSQSAPPRVVVAEQPDSPLLILVTGIDSSNPLGPKYSYSITNKTEKPVNAYAVQEIVSLGPGAPIVGTSFVHFPAEKLLFPSHASRQEDGGIGRTYQQAPVEIVLAVDFVEFADGTRWGEDTSKSGELLDGKRAGGKAAMKKYREILAKDGLAGLEEALTNPSLILPLNSKSDHWANGFKIGVNAVKNRLKTQRPKTGDSINRELDKGFDATEGRQEPLSAPSLFSWYY